MLKNLVFKNYYYAGLILNFVVVLAVVFLKDFLPPIVPLLYGQPVGAGQLVNRLELLIAPGISTIIIGVNVLLSLTTKDSFSKKVLAISSLAICILTTITVIKIFFLVGFF